MRAVRGNQNSDDDGRKTKTMKRPAEEEETAKLGDDSLWVHHNAQLILHSTQSIHQSLI